MMPINGSRGFTQAQRDSNPELRDIPSHSPGARYGLRKYTRQQVRGEFHPGVKLPIPHHRSRAVCCEASRDTYQNFSKREVSITEIT